MHRIIRQTNGEIFGYRLETENGFAIITDDEKMIFPVRGNKVLKDGKIIGYYVDKKDGKTIFYTRKEYLERKKRKILIRKATVALGGVGIAAAFLVGVIKFKGKDDSPKFIPSPYETTIEMPDDDDEIKLTPTPVPTKKEEKPTPTQTPTRPENAIDVSFFVYTVKSGDTLEGITKRLYSTNILNAETANGRTEPEQNRYYDILYLVKNIARMNIKCNKMSSMNELMAGQQIILPDPDSITAETVDLICSAGATTFDVDFTNNIVVLVPTVVKQQSQGVSK